MSYLAPKVLTIWVSYSENRDLGLLLENVNIWAALSWRWRATVSFGWSMYSRVRLSLHCVTSFRYFVYVWFCKHFRVWPSLLHLPLWTIMAIARILRLRCPHLWSSPSMSIRCQCEIVKLQVAALQRSVIQCGHSFQSLQQKCQAASVETKLVRRAAGLVGVWVHHTHSAQCESALGMRHLCKYYWIRLFCGSKML